MNPVDIQVVTPEGQIIEPNPGPQTILLACDCDEIFFGGGVGGGKLQPLTSLVYTPWGPKKIGDIRVGDIICNPDGNSAKVMALYPQDGPQKIYKVTFQDGTSTRCGGDHLWLGFWVNQTPKGKKEYLHEEPLNSRMVVLTLDEIIAQEAEYAKAPGKQTRRFAVPLTKPVAFQRSKTAAIDPYLVGLYLGDGSSSQDRPGSHTGSVNITSMDKEIEVFLEPYDCHKSTKENNQAAQYAFRGEFRRKFIDWLKLDGLFGKGSTEKFIPNRCKYVPVEDRWALLQGLMDTDGTCSSDGKLYYDTTSPQLAKDVQWLIQSLGGWASITQGKAGYKDKQGNYVQCNDVYSLYIQLPDKSKAFRLTRKKERTIGGNWGADKGNPNAELYRKMVSIEEDGFEDAVCIRVDHPNALYLTDNFIVTHNSYGMILFWLKHYLTYGKYVSGMMLRQSYGELSQLIKEGLRILEPIGWEWKSGAKKFVSPDGAELLMRFVESEEDVKKYWGFELTFLGVDEYADMEQSAFDAVQMIRASRLRSSKGIKCQFVATGNPCRKGHELIKERYIDPAPPFTPFLHPESKHSIIYIPSTLDDNPKLSESNPQYKDNLRSMGPSHIVKAMLEGDWSVSPQGNIFLREYFSQRIEQPKHSFRICSWDTAFKTTKDSARSAVVNIDEFELGYYISYAWAGKVEFPELKTKANDVWTSTGANAVWIEDKASGQSLTQEFQRGGRMPVKAIKVDGDKLRRAYAVTPLFESGKIFLPKSAPWINEFVDELCAFPSTGYKDYVDATSQGLTELVKREKYRQRFGNRNVISLPLTGSLYGV